MTSNGNGPKGIEALFGIGQGLSRLLETLKDAAETADSRSKSDNKGEHVTHFGKEGSPFSGVASFRMRSALDATSKSDDEDIVANSRVKKAAPAQKPQPTATVRVPSIDVMDDKNGLLIVAELPGVSEDELNIQIDGTMLTIQSTGARKYDHTVDLKRTVAATGMTKNLRNGILEIRFADVAPSNQNSGNA
ncbi:MAG: Hsp20/alpha crystallin family protein [Rhizobiaceae bacterium]